MIRGWSELLRSLGTSLAEVLGAEVDSLKSDLGSSGAHLAATLGLALVAAMFFFWSVGALGFVLFQTLTLWLPRWGAALVILATYLGVGAIFALICRRRLQDLEPPGDTIRRHLEDHVEWWQSQVMVEGGLIAPSSSKEKAVGPGRLPEDGP